jgi:hypothetical protein
LKNKDQFGNPVASKRDVSEKRFELDPYRIACPQQSQADEACSGSIKLGGLGEVEVMEEMEEDGCTGSEKRS